MIGPIFAGLVGLVLFVVILWDAFETVLVPRRIGRRVRLTRYFYMATWQVWSHFARDMRQQSRREGWLGTFGPLSLLLLLACWATALIVAFALLHSAVRAFAGLRPEPIGLLLYMSGETFFTLGFGDVTPATTMGRWLSVIESGLGFGFLGTVVGYLPTMYAAFSQREIEISLLDARAGSPPTAAEFLSRDGALAAGDAVLRDWERWSAQLLETHISYPQLAYYRSQHSNQSWLGALVTILDASAFLIAVRSSPESRQADRTFAMARHALVDVTQIFVPRYPGGGRDRLPGPEYRRLVEALGTRGLTAAPSDLERRLAELRLLYEPYALAIADHLLIDLPPWIHPAPRRDNWRGGPWDKALASHPVPEHRVEEHF